MSEAKQFDISKKAVIAAFQAVKENAGSYGVDEQTIKEFEEHLNNNLYKLWNRMASGSYFPKPVRAVAIPKKNGGTRILGIPTVEDRIAQMVAKMYFEPLVEPMFYKDSYGYRPNKSAIQAVGQARERCFKRDWVLELDIKGLFDCSAHGGGICEALQEKNKTDDVSVVSLALPSMSATYLEDGSMKAGLAWRPADAGYATCYAAYLLASGQKVETGTDLKITGYEDIQVKDGVAYGNAPLEFSADNINDYKF